MAENTVKNTLATPADPGRLEPPTGHVRTNPFKKVGKLAVRAARAASNAATTGAIALARSVIKTIYGTTVIRPRVRVRKQPYFNLRDIKNHIYGIVGYLKVKYLAPRAVGSQTEDKNGKRHEVVLRERLEVSENEVIDLLDDAFAPSFVQRDEHATINYKETRRIARDLLVDVGFGQTGAPR
jgi:hypothetical protein